MSRICKTQWSTVNTKLELLAIPIRVKCTLEPILSLCLTLLHGCSIARHRFWCFSSSLFFMHLPVRDSNHDLFLFDGQTSFKTLKQLPTTTQTCFLHSCQSTIIWVMFKFTSICNKGYLKQELLEIFGYISLDTSLQEGQPKVVFPNKGLKIFIFLHQGDM